MYVYSALSAEGVAGRLAFLQGDYPMARSHYEKNLQIWRDLDDKRGIGHALIALGSAVTAQGDYAAARSFYEEGLSIEKELGEKSEFY